MTRTRSRLVFASLLALPAIAGAQDADLILRNARIWTGDSTRRSAEALAVRGERLIVVGTNAEADAHRGARTRVIDAGGRFVTPGFIDDHTHFAQAGALLIGANLLDVSTAAPFAARIKAAVARMSPGAWLTGGDWGAYEDNPPNSTGGSRPSALGSRLSRDQRPGHGASPPSWSGRFQRARRRPFPRRCTPGRFGDGTKSDNSQHNGSESLARCSDCSGVQRAR